MSSPPADTTTRPRLTRGADGWRGKIGPGFSVPAAAALAAAAGQVLAGMDVRRYLVTCDGRTLSRPAAEAAAAALAPYGDVDLVPLLPTPTATHAVRSGAADAALLITASHNPADANGVKLKVKPGMPPGPGVEARIEERRADPAPPLPPSASTGGARLLTPDAYVRRHLDAVVAGIGAPRRPVRVVVDGVHGVAGPALAQLCRRLGWSVIPTRFDLRADFGGAVPDPVRASTREHAAALVRREGADLALVTDGDGDRLMVLDADGATVAAHHLAATLIRDCGASRGTVAVTVSTGSMVRQVCAADGGTVVERPIGFKHLAPLLASGDATAGVGAVGDLAFADQSVDRDPLGVVVRIADRLQHGGPVADWATTLTDTYGATSWRELHLHADLDPAEIRRCADEALADAGVQVEAVTTVDGAKYLFDQQWLLVRGATTETGIRVFSEMRDRRRQDDLLRRLTETVDRTSVGPIITAGQEGS